MARPGKNTAARWERARSKRNSDLFLAVRAAREAIDRVVQTVDAMTDASADAVYRIPTGVAGVSITLSYLDAARALHVLWIEKSKGCFEMNTADRRRANARMAAFKYACFPGDGWSDMLRADWCPRSPYVMGAEIPKAHVSTLRRVIAHLELALEEEPAVVSRSHAANCWRSLDSSAREKLVKQTLPLVDHRRGVKGVATRVAESCSPPASVDTVLSWLKGNRELAAHVRKAQQASKKRKVDPTNF